MRMVRILGNQLRVGLRLLQEGLVQDDIHETRPHVRQISEDDVLGNACEHIVFCMHRCIQQDG